MIKRLLIAATILAGSVYHSQAANITFKYWFDQNDSEMVTVNGSESLSLDIDINKLRDGFHTIHIYAQQGENVSNVSSAYFVKTPSDDNLKDVKLMYSFDNEPYLIEYGTFADGTFKFELDATQLSESMHSVSLALVDMNSGMLSGLASGTFMRAPITQTSEPGDYDGDGKVLVGDLQVLINAILSSSQDTIYDMNNDGHINAGDIVKMIDIVMGR